MLDLATIDKGLLVAKKAKTGDNIVIFARMTWPKLFVAKLNRGDENKEGAQKKYTLNLLLPPSSDLSYLKKACGDCATARWGDKAKTMKLTSPFKKAEDYKYEGHLPGWTFLRLSAVSKPKVLEVRDGSLVQVTEDDPEVVYGGRWAQVTVNPFAYPKEGVKSLGNSGISLGLNNVLLLNHDEALGGRMKAEDEFEAPDGASGSSSGEGKTVDDLF